MLRRPSSASTRQALLFVTGRVAVEKIVFAAVRALIATAIISRRAID